MLLIIKVVATRLFGDLLTTKLRSALKRTWLTSKEFHVTHHQDHIRENKSMGTTTCVQV